MALKPHKLSASSKCSTRRSSNACTFSGWSLCSTRALANSYFHRSFVSYSSTHTKVTTAPSDTLKPVVSISNDSILHAFCGGVNI